MPPARHGKVLGCTDQNHNRDVVAVIKLLKNVRLRRRGHRAAQLPPRPLCLACVPSCITSTERGLGPSTAPYFGDSLFSCEDLLKGLWLLCFAFLSTRNKGVVCDRPCWQSQPVPAERQQWAKRWGGGEWVWAPVERGGGVGGQCPSAQPTQHPAADAGRITAWWHQAGLRLACLGCWCHRAASFTVLFEW